VYITFKTVACTNWTNLTFCYAIRAYVDIYSTQTATVCNSWKIMRWNLKSVQSLSKWSTLVPISIKRMVHSKAVILASSYTDIHRMQCADTLSLCVSEAQSWMQMDPCVSLCYIVLNTQLGVDSMLISRAAVTMLLGRCGTSYSLSTSISLGRPER